MIKEKRTIYILWTGGWDSTYRVVELSRKSVCIQPIYIYGEGRGSEKYEIKAMYEIYKMLNIRAETKATMLPIKFIDYNSLKKNYQVSKAFNNISKENPLGGQYEWLPFIAVDYPRLEIGIEKTPPTQSKVIKVLQKYGQFYYDKELDTYLLDEKNSTDDLISLFGNLSFPIINKSGWEMKENIINWGYEEVIKNIWVCHTPIFGKPCGTCHPCELKIETNMHFLLASSSLKRYSERQKNNKVSYIVNGILKKISYLIDKVRLRKYVIH